ncbi:pentatricopeptide repeat-containing protein At1g80150, mitochondrial-like [Papaver somniferum]|uniref:pentatricopeptide repeat-containing protein At1g80150, mitochondrial-like n=1 Tax=Papaver somniferum TaxID=3469 RepID=UPI000E6FFE22|nr:pentatricopeptide repeat-containing protein At1g80150, mitochondrial-like [Papaver somniferum]
MAKVADLIDPDTKTWKVSIIPRLFSTEDAKKILAMIIPAYSQDILICTLTRHGQFIVKSAYHKLVAIKNNISNNFNTEIAKFWKELWGLNTFARVKTFLWKCIDDNISSSERMARETHYRVEQYRLGLILRNSVGAFEQEICIYVHGHLDVERKRFYTTKTTNTSSAIITNAVSKHLEEPALIKLKNERNPDKLFYLFKANAINRLVIENRFAFEDTVSRLAGAGRFDYIDQLLEEQKTLPQGHCEGFVIWIITLYRNAGMSKHAVDTFYTMHLFGCPRTVNLSMLLLRFWDRPVMQKILSYSLMAKKVYSALHYKGGKPNRMIYQTMIHYLCEGGEFDEAFRMCKDSMGKNWFPSFVTIGKLLVGLLMSSKSRNANILMALVRERTPTFSKKEIEHLEYVSSTTLEHMVKK